MSRTARFSSKGLAQLRGWIETDSKIALKILDLIRDIERAPFSGLGKPEALKGNLKGYWSRRITNERRLLYKATDAEILIVACKGHYDEA